MLELDMEGDMTDKEKIEVLAKFAGFYTHTIQFPAANPPIGYASREALAYAPIDAPHHVQRYFPWERWCYPDGTELMEKPPYSDNLPDLLHSLDAQVKWLVPKLHDIGALSVLVIAFSQALRSHIPVAVACAEAILSINRFGSVSV